MVKTRYCPACRRKQLGGSLCRECNKLCMAIAAVCDVPQGSPDERERRRAGEREAKLRARGKRL